MCITHNNRRLVLAQIVHNGHVVTDEHRSIVNAPYYNEEIQAALFSIHGNKALGPDGFGGHTFRDAWDIIGSNVVDVVVD